MRLQLSLDRLDISGALELLSETADQVDIIEVGTPLLIREGLRAVRQIRAAYPQHQILADLKAMDGGAYEAEMAVTAGANIVTVLAAANSSTIQGAIQAAHRLGGLVMVDMIAVQDLAGRAKQVDQMGADYVCVHTAKDIQSSGHTPLQDLKVVSSLLCKAGTAVAGGIGLSLMGEIAELRPEIVIVGGSITGAPSPRAAAAAIRRCMN